MVHEALERAHREGGTLIIPAFSMERTQELLFEMNDLIESGEVKPLPVFLDSPLAIRVTNVYREFADFFNEDAQSRIKGGDDIFSFPLLRFTMSHMDSQAIESVDAPKVIIAGSGMSDGGRIRYHEQEYLGDKRNTLLIVGYQAAGTLGRQLQEGVKSVEIDGKNISVRAQVDVIHGYSAHKDSDGIFNMVEKAKEAGALRKVFVVLGEMHASTHLAQRIRDYLDVAVSTPKEGEIVDLS
jgi:metallo-beta-lactamase family protein